MPAPVPPITPDQAAERANAAVVLAQLDTELERSLGSILSIAGGTAMMQAVDRAIRNVVRGRRGALGDGWIA